MMFKHVVLSCIIKNNNHINFEMDVKGSQCMEKGIWYNTTIDTKINVQSFKDYFKTGCKERYELMCYIYVYYK